MNGDDFKNYKCSQLVTFKEDEYEDNRLSRLNPC